MSINGAVLRAVEVRVGERPRSSSPRLPIDDSSDAADDAANGAPSVSLWTTESLDANLVIGLVHKVSSATTRFDHRKHRSNARAGVGARARAQARGRRRVFAFIAAPVARALARVPPRRRIAASQDGHAVTSLASANTARA